MTLDGICDHTAVNPDEEIHQHYSELLQSGSAILYGRITYQLMEFWPPLVKEPSGNKAMDDFAVTMDNIPKIVFSRTLSDADITWETARLAKRSIEEEVATLKQGSGKDILVGSRSLIIALLNLGLIDEFQLCVHPIIAGKGLPLFEKINDRIELQLLKTKTFSCGAEIFYYKPRKK